MKYKRIKMLKSNFDSNDYEFIKDTLERGNKELNSLLCNAKDFTSAHLSIGFIDENLYLTGCIYKNQIFLGIYDEDKNSITFNDNTALKYITENNIKHMYLRLQNVLLHNPYIKSPITNAWRQTQPLLDEIINIQNEYENYKLQRNQYNEENIPNNQYIGSMENKIDKCICIYECLQEIIQYYKRNNIPIQTIDTNYHNRTIIINGKKIMNLNTREIVLKDANRNTQEFINIKTIVNEQEQNELLDVYKKIDELKQYKHIIRVNPEHDKTKVYIDKKYECEYNINDVKSIMSFMKNIDTIIMKDIEIEIEKQSEKEENDKELS